MSKQLQEEMQENTSDEHDYVDDEDSERETGNEVWLAEQVT